MKLELKINSDYKIETRSMFLLLSSLLIITSRSPLGILLDVFWLLSSH
jgi:hypothetical protein